MKIIKFGIIGGGLMGKEAASSFGRWFALQGLEIKPELVGVCDLNPDVLQWYKQLDTVKLITTDYQKLLASEEIDVIYVAVPHHLHKNIYIEILQAGKDLLGEKPFGVDLAAAMQIKEAAEKYNRFVRCSSEMPFLPGPQRVIAEVQSGRLGNMIEVKAGFLHSSDLNAQKPINWKRQNKFCGEIGVMGDLGMHVLHIPLRLGWKPETVFAQLQKIITKRPDGWGGWAECDTWNNATLNTWINIEGIKVPMLLEMKRLAPGETNTWYIEVLGTRGGVKYSTKDTKALWTFEAGEEQCWKRTDLGFQTLFKTITGGIFEAGFTDCFMQMFAAFLIEREGQLAGRFGCVTPAEAVESHRVFLAAMQSNKQNSVVAVVNEMPELV